jgi:hypothetical protein
VVVAELDPPPRRGVDEAISVDHETEHRIEPPEALERAAGVGHWLRDLKCEGLAVAKTQRRDQVLRHVMRVGLTRHAFNQLAKQQVADVRVSIARAGLRDGPAMGPQQIVDESAAVECRVLNVEMHPGQGVGVGESSGVKQRLPYGGRAALGPAGAILCDWAIKIDSPALYELQYRRGREGLGDRVGVEGRADLDRDLRAWIREPTVVGKEQFVG